MNTTHQNFLGTYFVALCSQKSKIEYKIWIV